MVVAVGSTTGEPSGTETVSESKAFEKILDSHISAGWIVEYTLVYFDPSEVAEFLLVLGIINK